MTTTRCLREIKEEADRVVEVATNMQETINEVGAKAEDTLHEIEIVSNLEAVYADGKELKEQLEEAKDLVDETKKSLRMVKSSAAALKRAALREEGGEEEEDEDDDDEEEEGS